METFIKLYEQEYKIIDALEYITVPDCFVVRQNKIGRGNGEGKLYVGTVSSEVLNIFDDFNYKCIIKKSDLAKYLDTVKDDFLTPQQNYNKIDEIPKRYEYLRKKLDDMEGEYQEFRIFHTTTAPPRVYINSKDKNYKLIREYALPNISYISILKLKSEQEIILYFRLFADYSSDLSYVRMVKKYFTSQISVTCTHSEDYVTWFGMFF
jgi:putative restriction endonuclease